MIFSSSARLICGAGYYEQALPYLQQVLRRTPDNARVLVLVGQIHLQANRMGDAEKSFRDALSSKRGEPRSVVGPGRRLR